MKSVSPDYYSEHIHGKSIIVHGDVWHKMRISGTHICIFTSLADIEAFDDVVDYIQDDCYIDNWTGIFTDYSKRKVNRETKTFDSSCEFIEYAKSFFAE